MAPLKIVTFLGTASQPTVYQFESGTRVTAPIFPIALRTAVKEFDEMLVFSTPAAAVVNWKHLTLLNDSRIHKVDISTGSSTAELNDIFIKMNENIADGDRIILDITHGPRSIPFLVFLFAAYLRASRKVTIEKIYYGAYDLGVQSGQPSPVLDLSNFVEMLDWIDAANLFTQTGSAQRLNNLFPVNPQTDGVKKILSDLAFASAACQPVSISRAAGELQRLNINPQSLPYPFQILLPSINDAFSKFSADPTTPQAFLTSQFHVFEWYLEKRQVMQAAALAVEWLIDLTIWRTKDKLLMDYKQRFAWSGKLKAFNQLGKPMPASGNQAYGYSNLPPDAQLIYVALDDSLDTFRQTWQAAESIRNIFAHAERRSEDETMTPERANEILMNDVYPGIQVLAERWGLI